MRSILFGIIFILLVHFPGFAQQEVFGYFIYETDDFAMPYRLHVPENIDPGKMYPLILYLHGSGERGHDNEISLKNGIRNFVSEKYLAEYPVFILVPQCPPDFRWVELHWALPSHTMPSNISIPLFHVMKILDELLEAFPLDTNRLYVTGLSMGGFGTWDLISRYPEKFAAAVPVCGGGDTAMASALTKVPVWAFHGQQDKVVIPERSENMVSAINKLGGNARLTIYQNTAHNAWLKAYADPRMIEWLFSQTRQRIFYED